MIELKKIVWSWEIFDINSTEGIIIKNKEQTSDEESAE